MDEGIQSIVNLGKGGAFTSSANDDARDTFTVRLEDLAIGKVALAFRHAAFLRNACEILGKITGDSKYNVMETQFKFLDECSISRNERLYLLDSGVDMRVVSTSIRALMEGKNADISWSTEFSHYVIKLTCMIDRAKTLGVDVAKYIDVSNDDAELAGFNNPWCRDIQDHAVETGDLVNIIIDAAKDPHLIVILRKFSPGINQVALPGGFRETFETIQETCLREGMEETSFESTGMMTTYHCLDTITSSKSDPRPRFSAHGTIANAVLRVNTVDPNV